MRKWKIPLTNRKQWYRRKEKSPGLCEKSEVPGFSCMKSAKKEYNKNIERNLNAAAEVRLMNLCCGSLRSEE